MGDLTNKQISQTYDGLIKTNDEQPISGTLKTLQDGVGNNLPMQVSTTGVNFTGTVTGIPASTDTTYDFGAAGAAGNINFALTGSDASNDIVTMQAGTNITLTDNGSNTFTIDAAGGGGGGSANSQSFSNGTIDSWSGPAGQDVVVTEILIPAGSITDATKRWEWRCPAMEGSEGQWIYTSFVVNPTSGAPSFDPSYWACLGNQTITGGADSKMWYRAGTFLLNGSVNVVDTNSYNWPNGSGDPVNTYTGNDWTVDQYLKVVCWADASNAVFTLYAPTLTIYN